MRTSTSILKSVLQLITTLEIVSMTMWTLGYWLNHWTRCDFCNPLTNSWLNNVQYMSRSGLGHFLFWSQIPHGGAAARMRWETRPVSRFFNQRLGFRSTPWMYPTNLCLQGELPCGPTAHKWCWRKENLKYTFKEDSNWTVLDLQL